LASVIDDSTRRAQPVDLRSWDVIDEAADVLAEAAGVLVEAAGVATDAAVSEPVSVCARGDEAAPVDCWHDMITVTAASVEAKRAIEPVRIAPPLPRRAG
jgi:hypothetical protein